MFETELKFAIPPDRFRAVEAAASRGSQRIRLEAAYFDTADRRLDRAKVSLRLRKEGRDWVQTVKAPGDGPAHRKEDNVPHSAVPRGEALLPDLTAHRDTPAGRALDKALGDDRPAVAEVFRTRVTRHHRLLKVPQGRIEIALDDGEIVAVGQRQRLKEIEFELKAGSPAELCALARRWVQRHGLWLDTRSKAERGAHLGAGSPGAAPLKAGAGDLAEVAQAQDERSLLRTVVAAALQQVLVNASEVGAGRETPEHVHQLRVGLRRLRTALRAFAEAAPELAACEAPLAQAFQALGQWRDDGVLEDTIVPELRQAGAPLSVPPKLPARQQVSPASLVRATPLQLALLHLLEFTMSAPPEAVAGEELDALLAARLQKLHRQVRKDGRRFAELAADEQHRVRKRLKRLRYLCEFVAPRFKAKAVKRYLAALEPAQDALGAHNDAVVALERFRSAVEDDPRAWFAVGWLTARLKQSEADSCRALAALNNRDRFWSV